MSLASKRVLSLDPILALPLKSIKSQRTRTAKYCLQPCHSFPKRIKYLQRLEDNEEKEIEMNALSFAQKQKKK